MTFAMTKIDDRQARWVHLCAAAAFLMVCAPNMQLLAQGLDNEDAVDTIIGSEVHEEQTKASADSDKVIAAIEKSAENTSTVRKLVNLDRVDIVFLADAVAAEGGPPADIEAKLEEYKDSVEGLRQEIEGNAMLFHAIDSRQVLLRDVLAIEFDENKHAVIYAAAKPAE